MSPDLDRLIGALESDVPGALDLRLRFGLLCAMRVSHLIEHAEVIFCLNQFAAVICGGGANDELNALALRANALANGHQGSKSLDGVGHAAVSASYAVAKAIAGKARQAAEYAAYAAVYGQFGSGATSDPSAFEPEYEWQAFQLRRLDATLEDHACR